MRKFISKFSIFCIISLVFATILDFVLCRGLLQMEDYRFQDYAAMLKGGMEHDVLIMGNSRGKSHFNPAVIDTMCYVSSFCIGVGGYPINTQVAKYHIYRAHNKIPRLIVQNVDFMTLGFFEDVRHQHQSEQFLPLVYDSTGRRELKGQGYSFFDLNIPLYRFFGYQQVIKNGLLEVLHLKHYVSRPAYKGHRPEEGSWNGSELERMEIHPVTLSEKGKACFEAFLRDCQKDSVKVVLVQSPMYVGVKDRITGLDAVRTYFEDVSNQYGCIYLDYVDDYPLSLDTANFCVSVHMNAFATDIFTKDFCKDLLSLRLLD